MKIACDFCGNTKLAVSISWDYVYEPKRASVCPGCQKVIRIWAEDLEEDEGREYPALWLYKLENI